MADYPQVAKGNPVPSSALPSDVGWDAPLLDHGQSSSLGGLVAMGWVLAVSPCVGLRFLLTHRHPAARCGIDPLGHIYEFCAAQAVAQTKPQSSPEPINPPVPPSKQDR
jgi:hypothetical protein